jgi:hypothetical protein
MDAVRRKLHFGEFGVMTTVIVSSTPLMDMTSWRKLLPPSSGSKSKSRKKRAKIGRKHKEPWVQNLVK